MSLTSKSRPSYAASSLLFPIVLWGCTTHAENLTIGATPNQPCKQFLQNLDDKNLRTTNFDIEKDYLLTKSTISKVYLSIKPIGSTCPPGEINPVNPKDIISTQENAPSYMDVAAGRTLSGVNWIQFIYPSIIDGLPGLSSSLVFYDQDGNPSQTKFVTSYHSWETSISIRSSVKDGVISYCEQNIDPFEYNETGDIVRELSTPVRSNCRVWTDVFP